MGVKLSLFITITTLISPLKPKRRENDNIGGYLGYLRFDPYASSHERSRFFHVPCFSLINIGILLWVSFNFGQFHRKCVSITVFPFSILLMRSTSWRLLPCLPLLSWVLDHFLIWVRRTSFYIDLWNSNFKCPDAICFCLYF